MNEAAYRIRQAAEADLQRVIDLEAEVFEPYGTVERPDILQSRFVAFPEGFLVLESRGELAGYGSAEKWLQDRMPDLNEDPASGHNDKGRIFCITSLAISLPYRGHGFGLAILDHLIALALQHACTSIVLATTHADKFYSKRGFTTVNERYQHGVAMSIMKLELLQF